MSDSQSPETGPVDYRQIAQTILTRRKLRLQFLDRQLFGEHAWELLLVLLASDRRRVSVQEASEELGVSPATALAQARMLVSFELVEMGDSSGSWADMPITLSEGCAERLCAYLETLEAAGSSRGD